MAVETAKDFAGRIEIGDTCGLVSQQAACDSRGGSHGTSGLTPAC
jgi:hypothetical protein